jgi:flagellar hook-length control protein FliK
MLAQSTNTAPATATHDPRESSPASALFKSAGGKKARGIAGLFSEILSQAQKNLGSKGGDATKLLASESHKHPGGPINPEVTKDLHKKTASFEALSATIRGIARENEAKASAHKTSAASDHDPTLRRPAGPGGHEPSANVHAVEADAKRERRGNLRAGDPGDPEAVVAREAEEKRRVREKRPPAADEAAVVAGAGANAKAVSANGNPLRVNPLSPGIDEDSSIEKKTKRSSSEPKVTVLDLRRSVESRTAAASKAVAKTDESKDSIREAKSQGSDAGREIYREFSLDPRGSGEAGGSSLAGKTDATSGHRQDFQSMMAERMRDAWNGEIVQSAHIVLKDGDTGIIRLRLRPESLGNVKIELNLSENNISGRVVVESDAAKNAFERNMNELADAFKQGGFDSARLEVSVGGGSGSSAQSGGAGADSTAGPFFSERFRSAVGSSTAATAYLGRGSAIDILA